MSKEKNLKKDSVSIFINLITPLLICVLIGLAITCVMVLIFSSMLANSECLQLIPVFSFVSLFIGCSACGILNGKFFKNDKYITCLISSVIIIIVLVILNFLVYKSDFTFVTGLKYLFCIVFCELSSLVVKNNKKTKRKH